MDFKKFDHIFLISDVHFGVHGSSIEWVENIKSYFTDFFIPEFKKYKNTHTGNMGICIAGDYFDNRTSLDINVMNTAIDIAIALSELAPLYILAGNHDLYKKASTDITSLACLKHIPNVTIMDAITNIHFTNGKYMTCIPWIGNHVKETETINEEKKKSAIILMHAELSGMTYDNGIKISDGASVKLPDTCVLYAGHIHKRQESKNKRVKYIGSPYHITQSDIDNQKGIYVLSCSEDDITEEFIVNDFSPKYMTIGLTVENSKPVFSLPEESIRNNYAYVVLSKKDEQKINQAKITEYLTKFEPKGLSYIVNGTDEVSVALTINSSDETLETIFENNISDNSELSEEDKQKLCKINATYVARAIEELGTGVSI